ncbi:MAG TPA: dTDP-4-dehydrorhamnose reductase [Rhizomicrobium sp.]|nr:dTDP-4-dehydrorhamnose reductase [Rhizomicrobium sp.]
MRILIIGKNGQIARELARLAWPAQFHISQLSRAQCDLSDIASLGPIVEANTPDIVINAAAYTAVDRAESEPELAMRVNGDAPGALARVCAKTGAALIQLSTDYVFDGMKAGAYVEDDAVNPLSVYGRSKEAGEAAIRSTHDKHIILRTSWVFSAHGTNFVKTMVNLATTQPELRVVADQFGAPTPARDVAHALAAIAEAVAAGRAQWDTFHFTGTEPVTWHGFAEAIVAELGPARPKVTPISTAERPTPACRPANSVLDCAHIQRAYGLSQPSWREGMAQVLAELQTHL